MRYPNLTEVIKHHPYSLHTFAGFANVTEELLKEVMYGNEGLQTDEALCISRYCDIPCSVLYCPNLIIFSRDRWRHWEMMKKLQDYLYEIWEWQKKDSHAAELYMKYQRDHYVNMDLDFRNREQVTYGRYLGVKKEMEDTLLFIKVEQDKIHKKPRELKEVRGNE